MDVSKSILIDIREAVGLNAENAEFDSDLLMHINASISKLNQNGIGNALVVGDVKPVWGDLLDPSQEEGNVHAQMIPLYIALATKLIFDPPPPSTVEHYSRNTDELLWRLKVAYESGE